VPSIAQTPPTVDSHAAPPVSTAAVNPPAALDSLLDPASRTDVANARRLVAWHGEHLRYCRPWKDWLAWDGRVWRSGAAAAIERAKEVSDWVCRQASTLALDADTAARTALLKFAKETASDRGIRAIHGLAASDPLVAIEPAQLDASPHLLNAANGTLDLRTGALRPFCAADRLTQLTDLPYDRAATAPLWERTLLQILSDDHALAEYVRRLLGLAMLGDPREEILPIWTGPGSNGKSLLMETLLHVLGPLAAKAPPSLLLASRVEKHPTELTILHGKRLVLANETDEGRKLDEAQLKALTGRDTITARKMRQDFWSFSPTHLLILATNSPPDVESGGDALWRRLRLIPFSRRFWRPDKNETGRPEDQADVTLPARLKAEAAGILTWLVRAALDYQADGLGPQPDVVTQATADYRAEQDSLGQWRAEHLLLQEGWTVSYATLRRSYVAWCEARAITPKLDTPFGRYLGLLPGVTRVRTSQVRSYAGVRLSLAGEMHSFTGVLGR
jgi:putative DNA primase/helicase